LSKVPSNANSAAVAAITHAANKYGLDPQAMIAVAHAESGLRPGAIGDGGHAFGLFQFNNAGGVITGQPNPERYLDPNFNAMEAARHMSTIPGLVGAKGQKAINLMVTKFERPADPGSEVKRASSFYGSLSPGAVTRAVAYNGIITGTDSKAPRTAPNASLGGGQGDSTSQPYQSAQSLLGYLLNASNPNSGDTTNQLTQFLNMPQEAAQVVQTKGQQTNPVGTTTTVPTTQPGKSADIKVTGPTPVVGVRHAKLIGVPYHGTHTLYGNWESDNAIDIALPGKTPVYATEDGVIGDRIGHINTKDAHMVGQRVNLAGKDNNFYYQHLATITVKAGQHVKRGDLIGYSGATNHVHFAVEKGDPRQYYK